MAEVQNLRKGDVFQEGEGIWRVVEHSHIKMGRGGAVVRLKLRNVRSGSTVERTYNNGERVQDLELEIHEFQYQYFDGDHYHLMDTVTFDQVSLTPDEMEGISGYLTDGQIVQGELHDGEVMSLKLPTTVDLEVVWADMAVVGDTAAGSPSKQVELSTGLRIQAPMFVKVGELIRVDTRDGSYVTRVKG
ncbi:MAG: elongation factor P [Caldilineaceae bacterium]